MEVERKMIREQFLQALERVELQLKVNWWDNLIFFVWLLFIGLAVFSAVIESEKLAVGVGVAFIFLNIFFQIAEHKELNKIRRKYEKAREEISTQQERNM